MKKLYMRTIIGSSGRDCVLIILFQLHGSKTGLFEANIQGGSLWPLTVILAELIQYNPT